ncbi:hypothetical protein [Streptomyces sp. NPDC006527]|uniref:hypothetical protein n=1 Tax=Streptomyces sp. NPDC006527 TaxID=3364749 RepID=UPI0036B3E59C
MLQAVLLRLESGLFSWLVCDFERRRQAHYERKVGGGGLSVLIGRDGQTPRRATANDERLDGGWRHPEVMSRWKLYDNWYADLAGLTVEQLRERRAFAAQRAQEAAARGMGRNSKAARDWRARLRAVDDELVGRNI